jgi:large repetitive protein
VAVLPGVYQEQVTMKQFVRLLSADSSSTDSTVFNTNTGDALSTIIRAPFVAAAPAGTYATITANGLESFNGLSTEIAGFTIASPLVGDPANGSINPSAVGILVMNSNIVIDKDFIVDGGAGIFISTSGSAAQTPSIENDGIIGNSNGVLIVDSGGTTSATSPVMLVNNDFAFNTVGLDLVSLASSPVQANIANNIFWENHDQSLARNGFAILSSLPNKSNLRNNLFFGNGSSDVSQAAATNNLGDGFSPLLLGTTAAAAIGDLGNFVGNPAFVFPIDPRPGSDGPANFFLDADFQLTGASAAIDNAFEGAAETTDFLGDNQIEINGGLLLSGDGPRDIGAFEFDGTGGNPVGGAFRVVTTSLVPIAGEMHAGGSLLPLPATPNSVTVTFSRNVNPNDISPTDLKLSGTALDVLGPVKATSLTWIDAHTVKFNLTGNLNTSGTLDVSVAANTITSVNGASNLGYSDTAVLSIGAITPPTNPAPVAPTPVSPTPVVTTPTPSPSPAPTPAPAPAPKGPLHHKKAHVVHPVKPVKHVAPKPVKHVAPKPKHVEPKIKHVAPKPKAVHPAPKKKGK